MGTVTGWGTTSVSKNLNYIHVIFSISTLYFFSLVDQLPTFCKRSLFHLSVKKVAKILMDQMTSPMARSVLEKKVKIPAKETVVAPWLMLLENKLELSAGELDVLWLDIQVFMLEFQLMLIGFLQLPNSKKKQIKDLQYF